MLDIVFWKKYFSTYDILNKLIPYQNLLNDLIEYLEIRKGDIVLDAGAGTGNLSILLKKIGANVLALDSSKEGLERLKIKDKDNKIVTLVFDLSKKLPFEDNYFDKIVSNNVIYTLNPDKRISVMREFHRVLKQGGKIVISNVIEGWSPLKIYLNHLDVEKKEIGIFRLLWKILALLIPTVRMFYYNSKIKKEEGVVNSIKKNEQMLLLAKVGFVNISPDKLTYADQAILNSANK